MGWTPLHAFRLRLLWRIHGRRVEAAIVGAALAAVFLILRPATPAIAPEVWPDDIVYRPESAEAPTPQPPVPGYDDVSAPDVVVHRPDTPSGEGRSRRPAGGAFIHVIDGDGLEIDGQHIRLHGIDAFEYGQRCGGQACGEAARAALSDLIQGRTVECRPVDVDRHGRTVARCFADGQDLGAAMVRDGMALAYRRYSSDYVDEEAGARRSGAGAWSGDFEAPEQWRREGRGS